MKMLWIIKYLALTTLFIYETIYVTAQATNKVEDNINKIFNRNLVARTYPPTNPPTCECVAYYLCNGTKMNTNGEGIIDIRNNDNECVNYMERCCSAEDVRNNTNTPFRKIPEGCGYRRPSGVGMETIGDTHGEAKFGEFPWMVAILSEEVFESKIFNTYKCGGSLIHPRVVLTAAHCVSNNENSYKIRAGEWDTQTTYEIFKHQERKVQTIIVHPDYYRAALFYDVALLILEDRVELGQHISVACLPQQSTTVRAGTQCWATGWGKDKFGAASAYASILKKIELPFVESSLCQSRLRTTRLGKYFQLHESFVCAGGVAGNDMCEGDGGSPLVCPVPGQPDRYQQVGIVAWGIGCGENGVPGVYGNVAFFRKWIDSEMRKYNLDTTQYQYQ